MLFEVIVAIHPVANRAASAVLMGGESASKIVLSIDDNDEISLILLPFRTTS
jgi:hypothetical protein